MFSTHLVLKQHFTVSYASNLFLSPYPHTTYHVRKWFRLFLWNIVTYLYVTFVFVLCEFDIVGVAQRAWIIWGQFESNSEACSLEASPGGSLCSSPFLSLSLTTCLLDVTQALLANSQLERLISQSHDFKETETKFWWLKIKCVPNTIIEDAWIPVHTW